MSQKVFLQLSPRPPQPVDFDAPEQHPEPGMSQAELRLRMLLLDEVQGMQYVFDPESTNIIFIRPEHADVIRAIQTGNAVDLDVATALVDLLELEPVSELGETGRQWGIKLHLNHNCNLACEYCYADGRTSDSDGTTKGAYGGPVSYMSEQTMRQALEPFMREAPGPEVTVIFFGGEPLLSASRFFKAVDVTNDVAASFGKTVQFSMTTNATLLTEPILDCLQENHFRVAVSVDGERETHDRQRPTHQGHGSYDAVVRGLGQLAERGIPACVRMTAFRTRERLEENHTSLAQLPALAATFQFSFYGDDATRPMTDAERSRLFTHYHSLATAIIHGDPQAAKLGAISDFVGGIVLKRRKQYQCGAGRIFWAVGAGGDVYPCHRFVGMSAYKIGNVSDAGFVFRSLPLFEGNAVPNRIVRRNRTSNCGICYAHHLCGGGCAQIAVANAGKLGELPAFYCQDTRLRVQASVRALAEAQLPAG